VLVSVLAVGCGSSESNDGTDVVDVVKEALTTPDPAWCRELVTQRFLDQLYTEGDAARRDCEQLTAIYENPRSVEVSRVEVRGDSARVRAAVHGGDDDGATWGLALVRRNSNWRVDRVTAAELDFERFLRAKRRFFLRPPGGYTKRQADCIIRTMRDRGEADLERAIVTGNDRALNAPIERCVPGALRPAASSRAGRD
jgi:hypothetical protein